MSTTALLIATTGTRPHHYRPTESKLHSGRRNHLRDRPMTLTGCVVARRTEIFRVVYFVYCNRRSKFLHLSAAASVAIVKEYCLIILGYILYDNGLIFVIIRQNAYLQACC